MLIPLPIFPLCSVITDSEEFSSEDDEEEDLPLPVANGNRLMDSFFFSSNFLNIL